MNILTGQQFSIEPAQDNMSRIILNGEKSDVLIEGVYLEFCVKTKDRYVVFTTDDVLHEDSLHIQLLDASLNMIDSADIGAMYSTGSFRNPIIESDNTLSFDFIGDTRWRVEVLPEKESRVPFVSSIKGVTRKHHFSQYFKVEGAPKPEQP